MITVQSYLLYAGGNRGSGLREALARLPAGCEVIPAENRDVLVLVTETADESAQAALEKQLEQLPGVECVALVSGWKEEADD